MFKLSPIYAWIANTFALIAFLAPIKSDIELIENSGHAEIHALIYLFLYSAFRLTGFSSLKVLVGLILQGILVEIIQPYFGRGFSYGDMLGNSLGAFLGLALFYAKELLSNKSTGPSK